MVLLICLSSLIPHSASYCATTAYCYFTLPLTVSSQLTDTPLCLLLRHYNLFLSYSASTSYQYSTLPLTVLTQFMDIPLCHLIYHHFNRIRSFPSSAHYNQIVINSFLGKKKDSYHLNRGKFSKVAFKERRRTSHTFSICRFYWSTFFFF